MNPLTLGGLIQALERIPKAKRDKTWISFRFGCAKVGGLRSYRGDYASLALGFSARDGQYEFVSSLLEGCQLAVGEAFLGYKGGSCKMGLDTDLHVANLGDTSDTRIVGVSWEHDSRFAYIETAEVP